MLYPLLLIAGAVALAFYIREKTRAYTVKAVLLKALVSVLFLSVGLYGAWRSAASGKAPPLAPLVLLGLICGLLGDVWLDLKYVFPEQKRPFTLAGFCSFGIGHVLFIAGLLLSYFPSGRPLFAVLPLVIGLLLGVGNVFLEKPMKLRYGELKPVVVIYGALLFSTLLCAGSLALAHAWQERALNLFFLGAVLFAASDLILSGTYFGEGKERPVDLALNYLTYYPAQFLIASSLLFL